MNGTIDVHGLCFHWRIEEDGGARCTLHVCFGDLATSRCYDARLSLKQAEEEARSLAPLAVSGRAEARELT
jgi:hypothetical protein